ncbi:AsmA-like C-terminal region-containing protein [Hydrotalea sp.]|uniref:AsmA-like C-terminal region-containing protein n=1 Tax=Hydrotalea sp. TaxID=2881279 RepID=UPI003D111C4D
MSEFSFIKKIRNFVKIIIIVVVVFFGLLFALPLLFPTTVSNKIQSFANSHINGQLAFSKVRLSFFNHFPSLTLTLYDCSLKGSAPFQNDTLLSAKELAFGINVASLLSRQIKVDEVYLTKGNVWVQVDTAGHANYNIWQSSSDTTQSNNDSSGTALKIERIQISKTNVTYNDQSLPMLIRAKQLNYLGKGDLSKAVFDLHSSLLIDSLDIDYANNHYVGSKKFKAQLITKVNTHSLSLLFEKNKVLLNQLPFRFQGRFDFLKDGYYMNFNLQTKNADLYDVLSAIPPEYNQWFSKMDAKGATEISAALKGIYRASTNTMPTFTMHAAIKDGYLDHEKAPAPIHHLNTAINFQFPQFNTDSLQLNIDTLYFSMDKSFCNASAHITGVNTPFLQTHIQADLNLQQLQQALGIASLKMRGHYILQAHAQGIYATKVIPNGLRKVDTVISSIPVFNLHSSLENGFVQLANLPKAIDTLQFQLNAHCADGQYQHIIIELKDAYAKAMDNYVKAHGSFTASIPSSVAANIMALVHLNEIKDFFPIGNYVLNGLLTLQTNINGNINPQKKLLPIISANVQLANGSILTPYYPKPIEAIDVQATVSNSKGNYQTMKVNILPIRLSIEGQPFLLRLNVQNFNNLYYNLYSTGTLDLNKMYQVFHLSNYRFAGLIKTNLTMQGHQNDALAGRYQLLYNKGTLQLNNVQLYSDLYTLPFIIHAGKFHFDQGNMVFDDFKAGFGQSDFTLNGSLENVINYVLSNQPLKGQFQLNSNKVNVDEFMAFKPGASNSSTTVNTPTYGVVMIPDNLSLTLNANLKKVLYNGIPLDSLHGSIIIDSGSIQLQNCGVNVIGTQVQMQAKYKNKGTQSADFYYQVNAKDFDIQRAYREIPIFRTLASSATYTKGIVALQYQLSGRLNNAMMPIYPSLTGGGVLNLKKVSVKGFRLFEALSKASGRDSLNNPALAGINIHSKIAKNIITIERTRLKIFGFRPRFQGQISFDGKLNLSGRLGLPPLGIIGIPFTVTGTEEKPMIKMRRETAADELKETDDE